MRTSIAKEQIRRVGRRRTAWRACGNALPTHEPQRRQIKITRACDYGLRHALITIITIFARNREAVAERKTILGIDPGTNYTGYGVLEVRAREPRCVVLGYIELNKVGDTYQKLRHIFERVGAIIDEYRPDEVALESPFFGENVQSMLKLGRAQGVAMAAALTRGLPVFEYAPRRIKQSITGSGAASKERVAKLLQTMLRVEYTLKKLDATDGLAVALCHHFETCSPLAALSSEGGGRLAREMKAQRGGGAKSWEEFVARNPERTGKSVKKL
jgi:crossover junction endodeoxyribonuclease RuvC